MPLIRDVNCTTSLLGGRYIAPMITFLSVSMHFLLISTNLLSIMSLKMSRSFLTVYVTCSVMYRETPPPLRIVLYELSTLFYIVQGIIAASKPGFRESHDCKLNAKITHGYFKCLRVFWMLLTLKWIIEKTFWGEWHLVTFFIKCVFQVIITWWQIITNEIIIMNIGITIPQGTHFLFTVKLKRVKSFLSQFR